MEVKEELHLVSMRLRKNNRFWHPVQEACEEVYV